MKTETKEELQYLAEFLEEGFQSFTKKEKEFDAEVKKRKKNINKNDLEKYDDVCTKIKNMAYQIAHYKFALEWEIKHSYDVFSDLLK